MVFGPFRCHVIEFMLHGATSLKSLSLGIDYMDPILCPLQADTDDDYLGKPYLRKVLSSNKMVSPLRIHFKVRNLFDDEVGDFQDQLEELHLHSSSLEGRKQLDKSCGEFVLKMFPKLRHLVSHGWFIFKLDLQHGMDHWIFLSRETLCIGTYL